MKKLLFTILLFLLCLPCVKAYGIEKYYINATVQDNGDIIVEEYFNMTGSFNGFERIIDYKNTSNYDFNPNLSMYGPSSLYNGSGIEMQTIMAVDIDPNFNFTNITGTTFNKVSSASKGDFGKYTVSSRSTGYSYLIYLPSSKKKAFYLKYKVSNVAVLHNDVAELYWNIFDKQLREDIGDLVVTVNFPNNKNLRVWAHGPLEGNVEKVGTTKLVASMHAVPSNTAIDVRATFDKELISSSSKKTNVNALDKILNYEEDKAREANYEREQLREKNEKAAKEELEYCEQHPTITCYKTVKDLIKNLVDNKLIKDYTTRIEALLPTIIKDMTEEAQNRIEDVRRYPSYQNYNNTIAYIETMPTCKERTQLLKSVKELLPNVIEFMQTEALYKIEIVRKNPTFKNYSDTKIYIESMPTCKEKTSLLQTIKALEKIVKEKEHEKNIINIVFSALSVIGICIITYLTKKYYQHRYKQDFDAKYLREIPEKISPTTLGFLLHKEITNDAISALILKLINQDVIRYEKITNTNYKLIDNSTSSTLTSEESRIIKLIFHDSKEVTLKGIKGYARIHYSTTRTAYNAFRDEALSNAKKENYYEKDPKNKEINGFLYWSIILPFATLAICFPLIIIILPISLILFVIGLIVLLVNGEIKFTRRRTMILVNILMIIFQFIQMLYLFITLQYYHFSLLSNLFVMLIAIISIVVIKKLEIVTKKGQESLAKWKALKNFFNDFSRFDEKELPEVKLWKDFLVYATVMGCAKKLAKQMNLKLASLNQPDINYESALGACYVGGIISSSVLHAERVAASAYNVAHSSSGSGESWSSGSGHGGGFSSGGGHGGGGGGGGRF